jgi:hypothetical protein
MSVLRGATNAQREALHSLTESRESADAWVDDQRRRFDRECLDPLLVDGRRFQEALMGTAREIIAAERMLAE